MKSLLADLKHALRLYGRTPIPILIAVVALAVGMAFVGAFLSLYVDLLLRPHPGIEDSGRIVTMGQVEGTRFGGLSLALVERMGEEMTSLDSVVGVISGGLPGVGESGFVQVEAVTAGFFEGIRPRLAMGRGLELADYEPDAEPVAVISDRYWREELEQAPDVIGTTMEFVNQQAQQEEDEEAEVTTTEFRIIGIMAPEFRGSISPQPAFWAPFEQILPFQIPPEMIERIRRSLTLIALGRLSDSASSESVVNEFEARYADLDPELQIRQGYRFDAMKGVVRNLGVHRDAEKQLNLFLVGSILLALVAAANVSLFLLARAPGRRRELAIRMSVGAPVKRLARQLASEAGLVVVISAALGLLASIWLVNFLRGLAFLRQAEWSDITLLDWRVLGSIGVFLLLLTTLVSLAPILGLKKLGIASSSRHIAARATLAQKISGTVQIAFAGTLGGAAIAFAWYLGSMTLGYPGYETENRYYVQFSVVFNSASGVNIFESAALNAVRNREIVSAVPGIRRFSFGSLVPASQAFLNTRPVPDPDDPNQEIMIGNGYFDEGFIDVLGLRLLYGRSPDANEEDVALINQAMARRFFGRDNVVGEVLDLSRSFGARVEIVGVLEDLSFVHPAAEVGPMLFMKQPPNPFGMSGVVESSLPAAELLQSFQDLIDSGELELGFPRVRSLTDLRENLIAPDKARSLLTIATSSLVVLLAAFGFYGTQRYLVSAGRREYAIRASLGAGPKALGRLVFVRGLWLSLPGLAVGALLAFIVVAWLRDDFISRDISPGLVTVLVIAGLTLLLLAASLGPARQARRTQPAPLLREE